ncbi:MAG TPA: L,D-transpeptidase [Burkholderiaceae bacterium]
MMQEDDAPAAGRARGWPRTAAAVASVIVLGAGLFASTELHGIPSQHATRQASSGAAIGAEIALADDPPPGRVRMPYPDSASTLPPGSPFVAAFKGSPESRLIGIYQAIGEQKTDIAIDAAASLVHDVPGFRLAQLVYGDLLSARMGNSPRFTTPPPDAPPAEKTELAQLHDEAVARLQALQERPPAGEVPAEFILLPRAVHHAIAVDTSRQRLYLFENGPQGMRLVSDHYVSVGKQGVGKEVKGDQRTPLGVYFVSDRMANGALAPEFGSGAMELNYPNLFDKINGRTGSGIYLHGVPFNTYSRPPRDSDGCITLANADLTMLMNTVPLHDTPVIVTRKLHWVPSDATAVHRAEILDAINHWQSVRAADDRAGLAAFYEPGAEPPVPLAPPEPVRPAFVVVKGKRRALPPAPRQPIVFDDLSVLTWSDAKETMVVTFHEHAGHSGRERVLRQYWERDRDQWKIMAEGTVR